MTSYKHKRRSFLAGTGAASALHTILRGMEGQAQAATAAPKRLLVTHHPVGTCRYAWVPTGSGATYTQSRILKPFEDAGLRDDMIVLDGLNMDTIGGPGGGHEKGTVVMMTGTPTKGTRSGQTETDDAASAGPSVDQLLLALRPAELAKQTFTSLYALCDDRVDFREISTRCMRYSMDRGLCLRHQQLRRRDALREHTAEPRAQAAQPLHDRVRQHHDRRSKRSQRRRARSCASRQEERSRFSLSELTRLRSLAPAARSLCSTRTSRRSVKSRSSSTQRWSIRPMHRAGQAYGRAGRQLRKHRSQQLRQRKSASGRRHTSPANGSCIKRSSSPPFRSTSPEWRSFSGHRAPTMSLSGDSILGNPTQS